jgi:hypothetical protein
MPHQVLRRNTSRATIIEQEIGDPIFKLMENVGIAHFLSVTADVFQQLANDTSRSFPGDDDRAAVLTRLRDLMEQAERIAHGYG